MYDPGQLTRVNDQTDLIADPSGTTWVITYDLGGNILTKKLMHLQLEPFVLRRNAIPMSMVMKSGKIN